VGIVPTPMKQKISICIDDELVEKINIELKKGIFRSRSHVIEIAVNGYLRNSKNKMEEIKKWL
jgi:metal-responsive CopG/Arc/MetJ family transcriptional regulator